MIDKPLIIVANEPVKGTVVELMSRLAQVGEDVKGKGDTQQGRRRVRGIPGIYSLKYKDLE